MSDHAVNLSALEQGEEPARPVLNGDLFAPEKAGLPQIADASPGVRFDYSEMDEDTATEARAAVERYRSRSKAYLIDTGRDLLVVKEGTEHGLFLKWVQEEMRMEPRSAQRAMNVAAVLGPKSDTVSYLPPTILYALAARSTPAPLREEIVQRLEAGEPLTAKSIDRHLRDARVDARQAKRDAKLSPEERKRQAQAKKASDARRKREHEKHTQEMAERDAKRIAEAEELAGILAPLLDADAYRRVYELINRVYTSEMRTALSEAWGQTEVGRAHHERQSEDLMGRLDE